jgi:oligosaccharide repeat unit polymerase
MEGVVSIIFFSFVIHIVCYIYISKVEGSYLNVFFPFILSSVPINFVFEPAYIYYNGLAGSEYSYFYLYSCFTSIILFMTWGYVLTKNKYVLKLPYSNLRPFNSYVGIGLIMLGFITYLPVLIEFREYIFNPREIYVHTRTGYGLYFFLSTFLSLVGFIVFLFSKKANLVKVLLLSVLIIVFLYLHGSKGQVNLLFTIVSLYYVYIKGWKVSKKALGVIALAVSCSVMVLFYLTTSYEYENIFKLMTSFSDYNRNAMLIIDKQKTFYNGQLTFESNFYSRIPRALMPDKPKDYGVFKLAKQYYPSWFYEDTGSPAFGLGVQYADFGGWAIFYLSAWALLLGCLLKLFIQRLKKFRTPGDFIVVLYISGITLLPLGDGYLLLEHLMIALLINMLLSIKIKA